jgi:hypothetical protein
MKEIVHMKIAPLLGACVVAGVGLAPVPSFAQTDDKAAGPPPTAVADSSAASGTVTVKMSINQVIGLQKAISGLDSYTDTDATGKPVTKRYMFSVPTRIILAQDSAALNLISSAVQAQQTTLLSDISGGAGYLKPGSPETAKFNLESLKLGEQQEPVELDTLTEADLGLERNPIPTGVLAALTPIIAK